MKTKEENRLDPRTTITVLLALATAILLGTASCSNEKPAGGTDEVITCFNDDDCPGTQWCENNVCVGEEETRFCRNDDDCPGDMWCRDHVCVKSGDSDVDSDTDLDTDVDTDTDADTDTDTYGCKDQDHDRYGDGPDCLGMDCDDTKANVNPGQDEVCDGLDNDCDGKRDEDVVPPQGTCKTKGVCANVTARCVNGIWQCDYPSTYEVGEESTCDGLDNDCDGEVDENLSDCSCREGEKRPCGTDVGECEKGYQYCVGGKFGPCDGIGPKDETCDGKDNDCDGQTDEDLTPPANPCLQKGVCENTDVVCNGPSGWQCDYPSTYESGMEKTCDGLDNDCDGLVDEDLEGCDSCKDGEERPCSTDVGTCTKGIQVCKNGTWGQCSGQEPVDEICDGLDNDCDGTADNHLTDPPPDCLEAGVCAGTNPVCDGSWKCPYPDTYEQGDETSCDGLDNDCDGRADEGLISVEEVCTLTKGVCSSATAVCDSDGNKKCLYPDTYEEGDETICDGLDNDCDGETDENLSPPDDACSDLGVCKGHPAPVCNGTDGWDCNYPETYEQGEETTCDGLDNDCDGETDEGMDKDSDGVTDCRDNCPETPNPDQRDQDGNGIGDACEVECAGAVRIFSGDHIEDDTTGKGDDYNAITRTDWLGGYIGGCPADGYKELGDMSGPDLLYEVTVKQGQTLKVTAVPQAWDLGLYIISECDDFKGDTCQLWSDGDGTETIEGVVNKDSRLLIVVDGYKGDSGRFTLDVQITDPPEGEVCGSAFQMEVGKVYTGNTTGAKDDAGRTCSQEGAPGPDVFYSWTAPVASNYLVAAAPKSWDLSLYLFQDCNDISGSCVGGADKAGSGGLEYLRVDASQGESGYVAVDGYGSGSYGLYAVTVLDMNEQSQEKCDSAYPVEIGKVVFGDTAGATKDHDACKSSPGPDHVYSLTAQATEQVKITALPDSTWDLVLYVFSDCSNPSNSCEAGSDRGSTGEGESVTITVEQGKTYYIVVDAYRSDGGGVYALQVTKP